jgi:hypothetical protein
MALHENTRVDWWAHVCKIADRVNAQTDASREAVQHAFATSIEAASLVPHPSAAAVVGTRAGMGDILAHLQGFARAASHEDLIAEIDCLAREVIR